MKSKADQFPLRHEGTLTNPYEGLVIGNGDLAAGALVFSQELRLTRDRGRSLLRAAKHIGRTPFGPLVAQINYRVYSAHNRYTRK